MASSLSSTARTAEREKRTAAGNSVLAALFLTVLKFLVGIFTGSLGILAEAAHSGLDLVAAVVTLLAVRVSDRPADLDHTYGHGKVENFSALAETILLLVTCAWIIYEAVVRLFFHPRTVDPSLWAFAVMAVSVGVDVSRSRMLSRVARRHSSQALEADALHFSTDIWSSGVVICGLALVWLGTHVFPSRAGFLQKADALSALGVAFIVIFVSTRLGKRTVDVLIDRAPPGMPQRIAAAAGAIEGVLGVSRVRVRRSGARFFVDMSLDVDRDLPFERTHSIAEAAEAEVREIAPGADVVVHTDPREIERETRARRIRAVAYRNQMPVHNIAVHEFKKRVYVDLHLEVDDDLSLEQAHEMASRIERDLREDMPEIAKVNTHIESRGTGTEDGEDVTFRERGVVERIRVLTEEIAGTSRCHNVTLRRRGERLSVSLHCNFDRELSIIEVHEASTRIEDCLKKQIPGVDRVLVHAEPETKSR